MKVYRRLEDIPIIPNAIITSGSFDGLHKGHQKIFEHLHQLADSTDGQIVAITFHPHPRQVLYPNDKSLRLLCTSEEKIQLFKQFGFDHLVIAPFTFNFSQQSPDEYIKNFIHKRFKPKYVVVGYDHRFGKNRIGDIHFLRSYEKELGFRVIEIKEKKIEEITISSTKIRNALLKGQIKKANDLLGYEYSMTGKVIGGDKLGRTIGFPTANLKVINPQKLIPKPGIYAARTTVDNETFGSMFYIGNRPSITDSGKQTLEVNIFEFRNDIYFQEIKVSLVQRIREDIKFDNMDELQDQLVDDKQKALAIL